MKVAVTRPESQSAGLHHGLLTAGFESVSVPLLIIGPPANGHDELRSALTSLESFEWVIFTSANAVEAFFADATEGEMPKVAAIGAATAEAAESHGITVAPTGEGVATAEQLVDRFPPPSASAGAILLPASDRARPTLADGLTAKGWKVTAVPAYSTTTADLSEQQRRALCACELVTLASPSAAAALVAIPKAAQLPVVTIGPTTSDEARRMGLWVVAEAAEQSDKGMVEAVRAWVKHQASA